MLLKPIINQCLHSRCCVFAAPLSPSLVIVVGAASPLHPLSRLRFSFLRGKARTLRLLRIAFRSRCCVLAAPFTLLHIKQKALTNP